MSEVNNINTARASSGATGDATAGLIFAGTPVPKLQTEYYDGTTWSEQADLASAHDLTMAGFGTTTAAVAAGGAYNPAVGTGPILVDVIMGEGNTISNFWYYLVGPIVGAVAAAYVYKLTTDKS